MIVRRVRQAILFVYACFLLISVGLVGAAAINDYQIAQHPGRALARVTHVDWLRTNIQFQDYQGIFHNPRTGLLYPTGLGEGQRVWVAYSMMNPDLVKVEGRSWTLALIPAASVAAISTLVAGVLWRFTGRWRR